MHDKPEAEPAAVNFFCQGLQSLTAWCYNRINKRRRNFRGSYYASREVDGVTVLDMSGESLSARAVSVADAIRDLISKGSKSILLNLATLTI